MDDNNMTSAKPCMLCVALTVLLCVSELYAQTYKIVDGGQAKCYDTTKEITAPSVGQSFYGQDAQFTGNQGNYTLSDDGKTVRDNNTGLTWMRSPNMTNTSPLRADKMIIDSAKLWVVKVNASAYGGYSDWRVPTIKEMYSLYTSRGTDPSSYTGTDLSVLTPFIDTNYFHFAYGQTSLGERIIDSQYGTNSTFIENPSESGYAKLFGVNMADGRIKGYDVVDALSKTNKTFFWQLVRGTTNYGANKFVNNGNGSVTDEATGLMWSAADNGSALTWQNALAWVQAKNAQNYLGYNDWRMPDIKELHSIVNYSNAPDYNGLPAIDTNYFTCSKITNENGQEDYPYYWSSSTHAGYSATGTGGTDADYIAFGRALGWPTTNPKWVDVHGAGAQRSDPKVGPPFTHQVVHTVVVNSVTYTGYSWGPQGDAIRGLNYVRPVRTIGTSTGLKNDSSTPTEFTLQQNFPNPFNPSTTITFSISKTARVVLRVYNSLGSEVATLLSRQMSAGTYNAIWDASGMQSGVYFYRLSTDNCISTKKMILLK